MNGLLTSSSIGRYLPFSVSETSILMVLGFEEKGSKLASSISRMMMGSQSSMGRGGLFE